MNSFIKNNFLKYSYYLLKYIHVFVMKYSPRRIKSEKSTTVFYQRFVIIIKITFFRVIFAHVQYHGSN